MIRRKAAKKFLDTRLLESKTVGTYHARCISDDPRAARRAGRTQQAAMKFSSFEMPVEPFKVFARRGNRTVNVGILIYENVEVLDFAGPFEVFTVASRVQSRLVDSYDPPFNVFLVAQTAGVVTARDGLQVMPKYTLLDHPPIDVLVVAGGTVDEVRKNADLLAWIRAVDQTAVLTASVCSGAFLLADAGLLDGRAATTHWEDADELARSFPLIAVRRDVPWVDEGRILTSAGIAAGIDLSLQLIRKLGGDSLASLAARQMEYLARRQSA